ncbi:MAG TPA: hypothetical protein VF092_13855 [Longimicrobium sp.]
MRPLRGILVLAAGLCCVSAAAFAQHVHGSGPEPQPLNPDSVPLWDSVRTNVHHPVTDNTRAQAYFDQGLALIYGFNHLEAVLSFQKAYQLDPGCVMCYWGKAVALGPNINLAMDTSRWRQAAGAIETARGLRPLTTMERAYLDAGAARYLPLPDFPRVPQARLDTLRAQMDSAYARAMAQVWRLSLAEGHPDLDAGAIAAEARMDLRPWNQWDLNGNKQPGTDSVLAQLHDVLGRKRDHVGAAHLWIHVFEGSPWPDSAEWAADTLAGLMPRSGHIVHMPSHIYHRLGRYADGVRHNQRAVALDSAYLVFRGMAGRYPMYWAHNHDFLWVSANFGGRRDDAMAAARALESIASDELISRFYNAQHFLTARMLVHVRFGEWDQALALPQPKYRYPLGIWHFGQGMARLRRGDTVAANRHLSELYAIARGPVRDSIIMGNRAGRLLEIAAGILDGEIRSVARDYGPAIAALRRAVLLQDSLSYDEPPPFPYAARHSLGAVLLDAGRAKEAEAVYLCDLGEQIDLCEPVWDPRGSLPQRVNRHNPWSLMGLVTVMRATWRDPGSVLEDFNRRWGGAPVPPGSRW